MKITYITGLVAMALGSTLAIADPSPQMQTGMSSATTAPPGPANAVWDGSDYVGQINGQNYYLGPNNTWMPLDSARQQRFAEWQQNNPNMQPGQIQSTRSGGAMREQNPSCNPSGQSNKIRNTRYQGHDMGQTRAVAPPQPTQENTPPQ